MILVRIPNISSIVIAIVKEHFFSEFYVNQVLEKFKVQFPDLEHKSARVKVDKSLRLLEKKGLLHSCLDAANKRRYSVVSEHHQNSSPKQDIDSYLKELKRTEVELAATRAEWEYLKGIAVSDSLISKVAQEIAQEVQQQAMNLTGKYSGLQKIITRVLKNAS